ncbi:hypothetical protein IAR50_002532 [Cryptococcus sp. DSM 104548]
MPRHTLKPLSRQFQPTRPGPDGPTADQAMWETLDRVQVLGGVDHGGHTGCVNALSWSEDGQTLLSGSDDRRLCIWTPDSSPPPNTISPHPLKLSTIIKTGHRNNIFSAKFLPHANTPTIVSVAGDRDIRVFDVERLGRSEEVAGSGESWDVLDGTGAGAAGVRTLQCHKSRVKRIATENSPSLFLTVSEDGTVRQHDLRLPHSCSAGFCPEVLFNAPRGVDLYSLSVSPVMPWMFTAAGTAEHAYVCDRRMSRPSTSSAFSWGPNTQSDGQVHCVRRLGLPKEEWERVLPGRRRLGGDRHISSVRMSGERGDEVAVAFMKHSTALFSTYDSPYSASARSPSASTLRSEESKGERVKQDSDQSILGKRSTSSRSISTPSISSPSLSLPTISTPSLPPPSPPNIPESPSHPGPADREPLSAEAGDEGTTRPLDVPMGFDHPSLDPDRDGQPTRGEQIYRMILDAAEEATERLDGNGEDVEEEEDDEEDGEDGEDVEGERDEDISGGPFLSHLNGLAEDFLQHPVAGPGHDDSDIDQDDFSEDDDFDMFDEDAFDLDQDDDEGFFGSPVFGFPFGAHASTAAKDKYDSVDVVHPVRSFFGALNAETVKDCNFLGVRSDKIASGSDDGHFMVWDKDTGRLEGVWEGDGAIVNMIEQHPTLPLIASSGIDSTIKLFSPLHHRPMPSPSFNRSSRGKEIVERNSRVPRFVSGGGAGDDLFAMLLSRGIVEV